MIPEDFVRDDEHLYRRIPADRKLYKQKADGTLEISSLAFSDRAYRVSVDRAILCNNDPKHTLGTESGGVVSLLAREIRNVDDLTRNDQKGNATQKFKIDIAPAPLSDNPAHAEIYAIPAFTDIDSKGAFHRLCRRLARLAESKQWAIAPDTQ